MAILLQNQRAANINKARQRAALMIGTKGLGITCAAAGVYDSARGEYGCKTPRNAGRPMLLIRLTFLIY